MLRGTGTTGRRSFFNRHAHEPDSRSAERVWKWIRLPIALGLLVFGVFWGEKAGKRPPSGLKGDVVKAVCRCVSPLSPEPPPPSL